MSDRNEWFKDVKRLIRGLEVETVEDPFACPTVKSVTDGGMSCMRSGFIRPVMSAAS